MIGKEIPYIDTTLDHQSRWFGSGRYVMTLFIYFVSFLLLFHSAMFALLSVNVNVHFSLFAKPTMKNALACSNLLLELVVCQLEVLQNSWVCNHSLKVDYCMFLC